MITPTEIIVNDQDFWSIELLDWLDERSFYTRSQRERLRKIDHKMKIGIINSDEYLRIILDERNRRQAECDAVAENLLAGVNF